MAEKKAVTKNQLIIGYVVTGIILLGIIVGLTSLFGGHTTKPAVTAPKTVQKPAQSPIDAKLSTLLVSLKKQFPSINDSYVYTSSRDGGGGLNQGGYYSNGAAFCDSPNTLYAPNDAIAVNGVKNVYGFECGGTVQVYSSVADAQNTIAHFESLNGNPETKQCQTYQGKKLCDYALVNNVIVHVSDRYDAPTQLQLLDSLTRLVTNENL
jgi:hypothetical protein